MSTHFTIYLLDYSQHILKNVFYLAHFLRKLKSYSHLANTWRCTLLICLFFAKSILILILYS